MDFSAKKKPGEPGLTLISYLYSFKKDTSLSTSALLLK